MKRGYVDLMRGQMHYRYGGNGTSSVVMVHMSGGSSAEFEEAGDLLAGSFTVFAPDLFGFGCSDKPRSYLSVREHADTVLEFMDAMKLASAYMIGSLVGANICARLAEARPHRVKGLMLAGLCYNPDPCFYPNLRHSPIFVKPQRDAEGTHLRDIWEKASRYGENPEIRDRRALGMHMAGDFVESMHWALCEDTDFEKCLPHIQAPTVVASYDVAPIAGPMPREAAKRIPGACHIVLRGCSPLASTGAPDVFVAAFLEAFEA
ncbi:MAG: alpha/beta hydrolase [Clostridiales Family XIII bacterium]|jgi:pimeloyl-ACP methyl ester carboxylesterase|nr:alpha/beta hydrolase [Clostridiales Family XIII bacterium]